MSSELVGWAALACRARAKRAITSREFAESDLAISRRISSVQAHCWSGSAGIQITEHKIRRLEAIPIHVLKLRYSAREDENSEQEQNEPTGQKCFPAPLRLAVDNRGGRKQRPAFGASLAGKSVQKITTIAAMRIIAHAPLAAEVEQQTADDGENDDQQSRRERLHHIALPINA